jgi:hypothetical protein
VIIVISIVLFVALCVVMLLSHKLTTRLEARNDELSSIRTALNHTSSIAEMKATLHTKSVEDSDRLAACVKSYLDQMDEYSRKLEEPQLALTRERTALAEHEKFKLQIQCPTKN